ncbi:hypothetical protein ACFV2U_47545 [Streptomyces sp. NPDC059697]|uniref:hypothetical protein n=1 Tax=Streptomyces sp. NPDC059697 TaxID=3346912 RepID=UPI0036C2B55B
MPLSVIVPPGTAPDGVATSEFVDSVTLGWSALGTIGPGALVPERSEPTRGRTAATVAVTAMAAAAAVSTSRHVRRRRARRRRSATGGCRDARLPSSTRSRRLR